MEPCICDNDNHALVHEREEDHEAASQDSHEALPEYDHTSPEDNGKISVSIQVDIKLLMVSIGLQVMMFMKCINLMKFLIRWMHYMMSLLVNLNH